MPKQACSWVGFGRLPALSSVEMASTRQLTNPFLRWHESRSNRNMSAVQKDQRNNKSPMQGAEEYTMSNIKIQDLKETTRISDVDSARVVGGAWYAKFDGVDGSSVSTAQTKAIIAICDGSVRKF